MDRIALETSVAEWIILWPKLKRDEVASTVSIDVLQFLPVSWELADGGEVTRLPVTNAERPISKRNWYE